MSDTDKALCDPDHRVKPKDQIDFHARAADHDLRCIRDALDQMPGNEAESASISRTIGVLFKLREKLRKPAEEPAKKK